VALQTGKMLLGWQAPQDGCYAPDSSQKMSIDSVNGKAIDVSGSCLGCVLTALLCCGSEQSQCLKLGKESRDPGRKNCFLLCSQASQAGKQSRSSPFFVSTDGEKGVCGGTGLVAPRYWVSCKAHGFSKVWTFCVWVSRRLCSPVPMNRIRSGGVRTNVAQQADMDCLDHQGLKERPSVAVTGGLLRGCCKVLS
jgi:hypothetical protein